MAAISHTPIRHTLHTLHTLLGARGAGGEFTKPISQQTHIEKERKKIQALAAISHTPIRHTLHTLLGGRGSGGDFTYSNLNIIREGRTLAHELHKHINT